MNYDDLITIYMDRFINQTALWSRQWVNANGNYGYYHFKPNMNTKGGKYLYEPISPNLVMRHLKGEITCAWPAIDENFKSKWLCFDSDVDNGELDQLQQYAESWGIHTIREGRRVSRAGHLWILFDEPVGAESLIVLGNAMIQIAGVHLKTKQFPNGIERFPISSNAYSQVRGPLGINLKPDAQKCRSWFDGVEQDIDSQLKWLAVQPLNSAESAIQEADKHRITQEPVIKIVNYHDDYASNQYFNILDHVAYRKAGNEYIAQCPICASEGHDLHKDNLKIKLDGTVFCCVYGGPGQIHTGSEIRQFLLLL